MNTKEKCVKVLQFTIGGPEYTGIASFLYQYYGKIDRSKVCFDFVFARQNSLKLVCENKIFAQSEFKELNAVKGNNSINYILLWKKLDQVFRSKKYDVFHINTFREGVTLVCLLVAKKNGIKTIISHSHNSQFVVKDKVAFFSMKKRLKLFISRIIRNNVDYMFACSKEAGMALFGHQGVNNNNFRIIPNAIDSEKFVFNKNIREKVRLVENVKENVFVVGQIGRLAYPKNQEFSINVLSKLLEILPASELWLIGEGTDKESIVRHAQEMNILDKVKFLGERNNVSDLMMAMDCLIFPSIYEGLGIVSIEAQAAGLPVFASTAVTRETEITELIHYLPLDIGAEKWAEEIVKNRNIGRKNQRQKIIARGYDIDAAVKWLECFYVNCGEKKENRGK